MGNIVMFCVDWAVNVGLEPGDSRKEDEMKLMAFGVPVTLPVRVDDEVATRLCSRSITDTEGLVLADELLWLLLLGSLSNVAGMMSVDGTSEDDSIKLGPLGTVIEDNAD